MSSVNAMSSDKMQHFLWTAWNFIKLYVLGALYLVKELLVPHKKPTGIGPQNGRVALVTGGGRGIGLQTVRQFLRQDMTVIIAGRDVTSLQKAVDCIRSEGITSGRTECLELDLRSLNSVRELVREFLKLNLPLHVLVNNAGIMFWPKEITEDGYESHWSVNYLGHFLLTHLLYPHLSKSSSKEMPSRIVNLTSSVHYIGQINFDDINGRKYYNAQGAYAQSKLAQLMFTRILDKHVKAMDENILVNAVHPGVVATELFQKVAWARLFPVLARTFLKNPEQGSDTVVYVALSSEITNGGSYYENCTLTHPSSFSSNPRHLRSLWDISCSQVNVKEFGVV
ncbi:dehydrogenase/reductase SDR family member on chromosome X homolog isoform X1 [Macrobrachium rosenbergii]|uniref:dehydrogenase/reductase SDR family member on chromosome X homolog isoform X1 n=2 Tax=Macrobrachium rosenbergii TaxID=79674 RepID=UPI0034D79EA0